MKILPRLIITLISLVLLFFFSCEDVIELEVQDSPARLIIEASLDWEKGTTGNTQTIKLSTSTPYFNTTAAFSVTGATVLVTNTDSGAEFLFEDQNDGRYITNEFEPILGNTYTLVVSYKEEIYTATETLMGVTDISEVYQTVEGGFDDTALEVNITIDDPEDEENYYLVKFKEENDRLPVLFNIKDKFINGNSYRFYYEKEEDSETNSKRFEPGDHINIELYGISKAYYNYIGILISQLDGTGLFGAVPVALRGNCINKTTPSNYPYGYFRLTQVDRKSYMFQ